MDVEFKLDRGCLQALVTGAFDLQEAMKKFSLVLAACRTARTTRVLIDFREVTGEMTATESAIYALKIAELTKQYALSSGREIRLAYLGPPQFTTKSQPGVEIARIEGIHAHLFTDLDEARTWLGLD